MIYLAIPKYIVFIRVKLLFTTIIIIIMTTLRDEEGRLDLDFAAVADKKGLDNQIKCGELY